MTRSIVRGLRLASGLLVAFAATAAPIEFVRVSATVAGGVGGGGNTLTYSSLTGLTSQGTALPPSTLTQTFSPNTSLLDQTAAWVSVAGTLVNGSQIYQTEGYGSVDLETGKLGVTGGASRISGPGSAVNGLGQGSATMRDEVTFNNATGAGVPIDIFFTLSGTQLSGPIGSIGETLRFCLGPSCALAGNTLISNAFEYMFFHNSAFLPDGNYMTLPTSGWVSTSFTPGNDPTSELFHGVYLVAPGQSTVDLFARLTIDCRFDAVCDYAHTGTLAISLAPGVTFASTSGVLLDGANPTSVPEPQTFTMFALAAAMMWLAAKWTRKGTFTEAKWRRTVSKAV